MSDFATDPSSELISRMRDGDHEALADVFSKYRDRLRRIVGFRLDHRLAGRVSESDVLQEVYIEAVKRLRYFKRESEMSPFLWLRLVTGQLLVDVHRKHFQSKQRDVRKEISLQNHANSFNTSGAIAANLVCSMTSVSEVVARAEQIDRMEAALNEMDPMDREVIALRHFEELSNAETASVLDLETSAASKRYLRAMQRLSKIVAKFNENEKGSPRDR